MWDTLFLDRELLGPPLTLLCGPLAFKGNVVELNNCIDCTPKNLLGLICLSSLSLRPEMSVVQWQMILLKRKTQLCLLAYQGAAVGCCAVRGLLCGDQVADVLPMQVQALQFEWAWQHPAKSKLARAAFARMGRKTISGVAGKVWRGGGKAGAWDRARRQGQG